MRWMTSGSGGDRRGLLASAVARYHAGCLRVIGSQNVASKDVRTAKKAALTCDVGILTADERLLSSKGVFSSEETLMTTGELHLRAPKAPRPHSPRYDEEMSSYEER